MAGLLAEVRGTSISWTLGVGTGKPNSNHCSVCPCSCSSLCSHHDCDFYLSHFLQKPQAPPVSCRLVNRITASLLLAVFVFCFQRVCFRLVLSSLRRIPHPTTAVCSGCQDRTQARAARAAPGQRARKKKQLAPPPFTQRRPTPPNACSGLCKLCTRLGESYPRWAKFQDSNVNGTA